MKIIFNTIVLLLVFLACKSEKEQPPMEEPNPSENQMVFDKAKWGQKEGEKYLFREMMLKDVVYNDTIRTLNKSEITNLLGSPDRINENHLYYNISKTGIGSWSLHTTTMVVKINEDNTIAWIKIHE